MIKYKLTKTERARRKRERLVFVRKNLLEFYQIIQTHKVKHWFDWSQHMGNPRIAGLISQVRHFQHYAPATPNTAIWHTLLVSYKQLMKAGEYKNYMAITKVKYRIISAVTPSGDIMLIEDVTNYNAPAMMQTSIQEIRIRRGSENPPPAPLIDDVLGYDCLLGDTRKYPSLEVGNFYESDLIVTYSSDFNGEHTEYDSDFIIENHTKLKIGKSEQSAENPKSDGQEANIYP